MANMKMVIKKGVKRYCSAAKADRLIKKFGYEEYKPKKAAPKKAAPKKEEEPKKES